MIANSRRSVAPMRQGWGRTTPSRPTLALICAWSCSASAREIIGPTRTRVSVPLSVSTDSVNAVKPAARSLSRSAVASEALLYAASCTANPEAVAVAGADATVEGVDAGPVGVLGAIAGVEPLTGLSFDGATVLAIAGGAASSTITRAS